MMKCPFCHFDNEDGALFCEQCKSDLGGVPVSVSPAVATAEPVVEAVVAEAVPVEAEAVEAVEAVAEPAVATAEPIAEAAPLATAEAVPIQAEAAPIVAEPMPAEPVAQAPPPPPPPQPAPAAPQPIAPTASGAPAPPPPMPAAPAAPAPALPPGAQPRLLVLRGQKRNVEYPLYEGLNFIGRADEKPVDIDLEDQEPPDRIWCSRQHACISFEDNQLSIEDLNSANGTYINRSKIYPGQKRSLNVNDIIQIGNVQLKVIV